jgi:hypothetical protein
MALKHLGGPGPVSGARAPAIQIRSVAWEKQVLSARGFKRVGRHSEYAI